VKGDVLRKNNNTEEELKPGVKVYYSSVLELGRGSRRGKIQIITSQGPVLYSRFPVTFEKTAFTALSVTQQDNYIASIGGTVISGRADEADDDFLEDDDDFGGESSFADEFFHWYMDIGVLTKDTIKEGFAIVLSRSRSSREDLSLSPLYFQLNEAMTFSTLSYEIMKDHTYDTIVENGSFTKTDHGLALSFRDIPLEKDIPYIVEIAVTMKDDYTDYLEFDFSIAGTNKMKEVESEIAHKITGKESDFEKNLIKARVYWEYNLKLSALEILKSQGLNIEDMM
jgi:hypothetical protein